MGKYLTQHNLAEIAPINVATQVKLIMPEVLGVVWGPRRAPTERRGGVGKYPFTHLTLKASNFISFRQVMFSVEPILISAYMVILLLDG